MSQTHLVPFFIHAPIALVATACAVIGFRKLRNARKSEDTPSSRIRAAHQGYVELNGVTRAPEGVVLRSPGNVPCVWWKYRTVVKEKGSKQLTITERTSRTRFYLEDSTGRCWVDPEGAELHPSFQRTWSTMTPAGTPVDIGVYTHHEWVLAANVPLYVIGDFRTSRKVGQPLDLMRKKLFAWRNDPNKRKLLDANRDGQLDAAELEAARRAALYEARREAGTDIGSEDVIRRPADGRPFIISPRRERVVVSGARWEAGFWFVISLACFVMLVLLVSSGT